MLGHKGWGGREGFDGEGSSGDVVALPKEQGKICGSSCGRGTEGRWDGLGLCLSTR